MPAEAASLPAPVLALVFLHEDEVRPRSFGRLEHAGVVVARVGGDGEKQWTLALGHPRWGRATLHGGAGLPMPPAEMLHSDSELLPHEASAVRGCGGLAFLMSAEAAADPLRQRKDLLQFARCALGDAGVAAIDLAAQRTWSQEALRIETAHDASLDIEGAVSFHLVGDPRGAPPWLHSHGLGALGGHDFDVWNPAVELFRSHRDVLRSLAYRSFEGELRPGATLAPFRAGAILAVDARTFLATVAPRDAASRDPGAREDEDRRVVLCEAAPDEGDPDRPSPPRPAEVLQRTSSDTSIVYFSAAASERMAARARATLDAFVSYTDELRALEPDAYVKLGLPVEGSGVSGAGEDREHLWFRFHGSDGASLDCTLVNEPFHVEGLAPGARSAFSRDLLTGWQIVTRAGTITPSFSRPLRRIRAER